MAKDVIIALDFGAAAETLEFLKKFSGYSPYVKVGMELFYAEGPEIVRSIRAMGLKIFLDLKLHDIPNTVKGAAASLSKLDIDICNVHAAGTKAMMAAAVEGFANAQRKPLLIAVTQLTSTSEQAMHDELLISASMEQTVERYAQNARDAGLDGVVCSPLEARAVKNACGEHFITVTPGVRFADGEAGDQARVTTPEKARELGSDYIVVGRPITRAADPLAAWKRCVSEFIG